ncbi:MAG: sigma 54-interacting transcriptional regulator [Deltaproteobacteria bacterium]|nr:sigma 54-interacting transcriptional regulator [Deltaproteobacteria bacterium]
MTTGAGFSGMVINGRYEVLRRLGGGAQGQVFEVRDRLAPDLALALKTSDGQAPGALQRFEFAQAARLSHPHLVKVFDLGLVTGVEGGGGPALGATFHTQELVRGVPAHRWARGLAIEERSGLVARVGVAVARALAMLHGRGLLHRDVKPSNILVGDRATTVKLIDLGLSRLAAVPDGLRAGTLGYMAPEALAGFADERSDLYGLGAAMAELLTGVAPRPGRPLPEEAPRNVPEGLWKVVERLCASEPEERFGSAGEAVIALGRAMGAGILGPGRERELLDAASEAECAEGRVAGLRSADLVGRRTERARIAGWLDEAIRRPGERASVMLVAGPPGVGKTRLLRAAVVDAQVRAASRGLVPPSVLYGTLRHLVRSLAKAPASRLAAWLESGDAAIAIAARDAGTGEELPREIARCLARVSLPAVLIVADADRDLSVAALRWLADEPRGEAGVVLAVAAEMRDAQAAERIAGSLGIPWTSIPPLGVAEEAALVEAALREKPDAGFMEALHARTGGLPVLTEAVLLAVASADARGPARDPLRFVASELPNDAARILVAGIVAGATPETRLLAEALAVLGRPAGLEEAMSVAGLKDEERAAEAAKSLTRRSFVTRDDDDRLHMSGLVGQAVASGADKGSLRRMHSAALRLLRGKPDADPADAARHALGAGRKAEARSLARRAADHLCAAGDLAGAAEHLTALLGVESGRNKDRTAVELARLSRQTGRYDQALALAASVVAGGGPLAKRALLEQAAVLRLVGRGEEALSRLDSLTGSAQDTIALEARALKARLLLDMGDKDAARGALGPVPPEASATLVRSGLTTTAGLVELSFGRLDEAEALFAAGLEVSRAGGDLLLRARFLALLGMVAHRRGAFEKAAERYSEALSMADEAGDRHGGATYAVNLAAAYTETDDADRALAAYRDGLARLRKVGRPMEMAEALSNYAELLLRLGDLEGAEAASGRAADEAERSGSDAAAARALCVRGDVLLTSGEIDAARAALERSERLASRAGSAGDLAAVRQRLAATCLASRDVEGTLRWLKMAEADALVAPIARLEQSRLELEAAMVGGGDPAAALGRLAALLPGQAEPHRSEQLRAFASAARAALALGRAQEADEWTDAAREIVERRRRATPSLHKGAWGASGEELAMTTRNAEREVRGWERLARINARMNSEQRLLRLLDLIMDTAVDITGAERGFLLVVDGKGVLRVRCARNLDGEKLAGDDRNLSRSVAVRAFESGEPVITTDAQADERFATHMSVVDLNLRFIVAVPLLVKGRPTGAIYVDSRRGVRFGDEQVRMLGALADQAAIAMSNARLMSENARRQLRIEKLMHRLSARLASSEGELIRVREDLARRVDDLATRYSYDGIVGRSPVMVEVLRLIDRVTDTDLPVVIQGESGTGKELVARAIHYNGPRKGKAFVAENCAAIPETLLESALFGHVRGAFTGAVQGSRGLLVEADGGTLFLDEVGEMPLPMQSKLLRVLQDGEVRPVGGAKSVHADVRIVVAGSADLRQLVKAGSFREDLYYRLHVVEVRLPSLRERKEDIPLLVSHFAAKHAKGTAPRFSAAAMAAILAYPWPGNVRQLENEIMRAVVLGGDMVDLEQLSEEVAGGASQVSEGGADLDMERQVERLKRRLVTQALKRSQGNQTKAAAMLGLSRYGLQKMLARFRP